MTQSLPADIARLPYRLGVGMMLLNGEGLVFVGRRIDQRTESWQMPQGGIDKGEEPRQTALRELREETGTDRAEILRESRDWLTYDLPPELVANVWHGRYRGQRQKWFLLRFTGHDADIDIATAHPEFDAWRWVAVADLPRLIIPFKRPLYDQVLAEFGPALARL